ncbi:MAG: DUF460 domain-containing protein [Candidatus Micrarchaeota archaeon]
MKPSFLIVGIDPGNTVGLAAFDLKRNLILAASEKEAGVERIVERLRSLGRPCLFACDVSSPHGLALELAAKFNARVFCPEKNLTGEEKRALARGFHFQNEHEMDALASALKALNHFDNKFRQIERAAGELGLAEKADEMKFWAMNGLSVSNAVLMVSEAKDAVEVAKVSEKPRAAGQERDYRDELRRALAANAELAKAVERLEGEKKILDERVRALERGTFERIAREGEVRRRDARIFRLQQMLRRRGGARDGGKETGVNLKTLGEEKLEYEKLERLIEKHRKRGI